MQLELAEACDVEVLAVHRILPGRAEEGVEVDLRYMSIREGEADRKVTEVFGLLDADVVCDLHFTRRVTRTGLMRLCST